MGHTATHRHGPEVEAEASYSTLLVEFLRLHAGSAEVFTSIFNSKTGVSTVVELEHATLLDFGFDFVFHFPTRTFECWRDVLWESIFCGSRY